MIAVVDDDDPELERYDGLFEAMGVPWIAGARRTTTGWFNQVYERYNGYRVYHLANDDFEYVTEGFDEKVLRALDEYGDGLVYCNDGMFQEKLSSIMFIPKTMADGTGWVQMPELRHLYGDAVWTTIASGVNRAWYLRNVRVRHQHAIFNQAHPDATFKETNSRTSYAIDRLAYVRWLKDRADKDIARVRRALFLSSGSSLLSQERSDKM